MKNGTRKLIAAILAVMMLLALVSCAKKQEEAGGDKSGTNASSTTNTTPKHYSLTVNACNAYVHPDLSRAVRAAISNNGMLLNAAPVNLQNGQDETYLKNSFPLLESKMFDISIRLDSATGRIVEINGIANGALGDDSYWMLIINNEPVETSVEEITVKDGDVVVIVYTCNGGNDIASPGSTEYTASPAGHNTHSDITGKATPDPNATPTPEPTETPEPSSTSDGGNKTSGRH